MAEYDSALAEQLTSRLASYGVEPFDRGRMDELTRIHGSAIRCGEALAESTGPSSSVERIDAVIGIIEQLWEMWFPDRPRLEAVLAAMHVENDERPELPEEALSLADQWYTAWRSLRNWMRVYDVESFARVDDFHDALALVPRWVAAFLGLLRFVSAHDARYADIEREVVGEILSEPCLLDGDDESVEALRCKVVWSVDALDGLSAAEQLLEEWLDADPTWAGGWQVWGELYLREMEEGDDEGVANAVEILRRGLTHLTGVRQVGVLKDLARAKELMGDSLTASQYRRQAFVEERVAEWRERLAEQELLDDLDEILRQFREHGIENLPYLAIASAAYQRDAIVPRLLDVVRDAADTFRNGASPDDDAYIYAIYLLTQFRPPQAFAPVWDLIKAAAVDEGEELDEIVRDDLAEILARVAAGHFDELDALIVDSKFNLYIRWWVSTTYLSLARDGAITRSEAIRRLEGALKTAIEQNDSETVTFCIDTLCNFGPVEARDTIESVIEAGLLDDGIIEVDRVRETIEQGEERFQEVLERIRDNRIDDALETLMYIGAEIEALQWEADRATRDAALPSHDEDDEEWLDDESDMEPGFGLTEEELLEPEPVTTIRREEPRVRRNDPCPCGSGKKYKKCCLRKDEG